MKRDPSSLDEAFEVVILGGGINGLCAAWQAANCGLRTALFEKKDFGGQTSSGSYKILHGGLRYLQHLNLKRMRTSIAERRFMMQIAPHLVRPMPFLVPCKGLGIKGPEIMNLALKLNDGISADRNKDVDPENRLGSGKIISTQDVYEQLPVLNDVKMRGAAVFYDGQMLHSERMNLVFAEGASQAGAHLFNYMPAQEILSHNGSITGVVVRDETTNQEHQVTCKAVVNLAGPWTELLKARIREDKIRSGVVHSKGIQIFTKKPTLRHGFAFESHQVDSTAVIRRGKRMYFACPFGDAAFWGTTDSIYEGDPDEFSITRKDVRSFLDEINQALPNADLTMEDIIGVCGGLRPFDAETQAASNKAEIIDHEVSAESIHGAISARGIKYTTARHFSGQILKQLFQHFPEWKNKRPTIASKGPETDYASLNDLDFSIKKLPYPETVRQRLKHHYGSSYRTVQDLDQDPGAMLSRTTREIILPGEIVYAIEQEMAIHLDDVLVRRTSGANPYPPSRIVLEESSRFMGQHLQWSDEKIHDEKMRVLNLFPEWLSHQ